MDALHLTTVYLDAYTDWIRDLGVVRRFLSHSMNGTSMLFV